MLLSTLKPVLLHLYFCTSSTASLNANSAPIAAAASVPLHRRAGIPISEC